MITFKSVLDGILFDLSRHKRDKKTLMETYINERLNNSLKTYYKELGDAIKYLEDKDVMNVARKLNKETDI